MCRAIKRDGYRCQNPSIIGSFCGVHKDQHWEEQYRRVKAEGDAKFENIKRDFNQSTCTPKDKDRIMKQIQDLFDCQHKTLASLREQEKIIREEAEATRATVKTDGKATRSAVEAEGEKTRDLIAEGLVACVQAFLVGSEKRKRISDHPVNKCRRIEDAPSTLLIEELLATDAPLAIMPAPPTPAVDEPFVINAPILGTTFEGGEFVAGYLAQSAAKRNAQEFYSEYQRIFRHSAEIQAQIGPVTSNAGRLRRAFTYAKAVTGMLEPIDYPAGLDLSTADNIVFEALFENIGTYDNDFLEFRIISGDSVVINFFVRLADEIIGKCAVASCKNAAEMFKAHIIQCAMPAAP